MFLRNYWYVAAWNDEVEPRAARAHRAERRHRPLSEAGRHHRRPREPLRASSFAASAGHVVGDAIQCGYHGLVYEHPANV